MFARRLVVVAGVLFSLSSCKSDLKKIADAGADGSVDRAMEGGSTDHLSPDGVSSDGVSPDGGDGGTCGAAGEPCCATTCHTGAVCNTNGQCDACGGVDQPCCAGGTCTASNSACIGGVCGCPSGNHACSGGCVSNTSVNSCGTTSCTACTAPPSGAPICSSGVCDFTCPTPGTHRCSSTCASDTDVTQCGPGPTCFSCIQPNANAACASGTCANSCIGGASRTLACPAIGGKPSCGRWDFESNTAEGWAFDTALAGAYHAGVGQPAASTTTSFSPTHSLAIQFDGQGSPGTQLVYVKVPLCANGQGVDLRNKSFGAHLRFVTTPGTPNFDAGQGHTVRLWTGPLDGPEGLDFSVDPATGGGSTPGSWYFVGGGPLQDTFGPGIDAVTHIGFRLLLSNAWKGTIYVDYVEVY